MNTHFADVMTLINVLGLVGLAVGVLFMIGGAALEQRHRRRTASTDHHDPERPMDR